MPVKLGGLGISKVYVGGTPVKVYLGDTLLLDTAVTPPHRLLWGEESQNAVLPNVREKVLPSALIDSDEHAAYNPLRSMGYQHRRVHHAAKVYVQGDAHTNTIEGFWSLVKRGISGVNHAVSEKYLQSYLKRVRFQGIIGGTKSNLTATRPISPPDQEKPQTYLKNCSNCALVKGGNDTLDLAFFLPLVEDNRGALLEAISHSGIAPLGEVLQPL